MSETTTLEPLAPESTDSEISTPPSEETQAPVIETGEAPAQGEETPETGDVEERTPESYSLEELNQLYRDGKLTRPELVEARDRQIQADNDRRIQEQRRIAEDDAANRQRLEKRESLTSELKSQLQRLDESYAEHGGDPTLIQEQRDRLFASYHSNLDALANEPIRQALARGVLSLLGDNAHNREVVNKSSLPELFKDYGEALLTRGRKLGPDSDHIVIKKSDLEKQIKDAAKKELDAFKATNGLGAAPPPVKGGTPEFTGSITRKQVEAMSPETMAEWLSDPKKAEAINKAVASG